MIGILRDEQVYMGTKTIIVDGCLMNAVVYFSSLRVSIKVSKL